MNETILEIHTSDLSAECLRSVELRWEGKVDGEMPGAMVRGSLWHYAAEDWHALLGSNGVPEPKVCVANAIQKLHDEAAKSNRPMTAAALRNLEETKAEVIELLGHYSRRFIDIFDNEATKVIGCEVPIRYEFEVDGEPVMFASHLDLLFRNEAGIHCWDWKTGEDSPTYDYLNRNMQLAMYALALRHGEVLVGGWWTRMEQWPSLSWCHVNNLAPYRRAVTLGDGTKFAKGDLRPLQSVLMPADIREEAEPAIRRELQMRVRMIRAGFFPTNPTEKGCFVCPSKAHCQEFRNANK